MASGRNNPFEREALARAAHDVLEFPLLLTAFQVDALERASARLGLTPGQLARRAIAEFLPGTCRPSCGPGAAGEARLA